MLKSEREIAPIYHRLPGHIRSHAPHCFLALVLHRVMRMRLHASAFGVSPETALERLRRIQYHHVRLNESEPLAGTSSERASTKSATYGCSCRARVPHFGSNCDRTGAHFQLILSDANGTSSQHVGSCGIIFVYLEVRNWK